PDYRAVWCYELESKSCKQFKVARIQEIEVTERDWENVSSHNTHFTDAFRISAPEPIGKVAAILSLKAYNLLVEEFPLCAEFVKEENSLYRLNIPVAGYQGIGRFVMGLPGEINELSPGAFKEFLKAERKKFFN